MYFAGSTFQGRGAGTPGGILARNYVADRFMQIGLQAGGGSGSYFQTFSASYANVIGILPGTDPAYGGEAVIIGAHYDHLGTSGSSIYYGADDNGSGTVALIEIAEAAYTLRSKLKRTLIFIAFDAEEKGLLGSKHYVGAPVIPLTQTVYMINLDMIGYLVKKKNLQCIGGTTSASAASMIIEIAAKYPSAGTPNLQASTGGSDHMPFAGKGIPYVFFHTGTDVSPYHTTQDTPEKIDYAGLSDITRIALELAWRISQESQPPQGAMLAQGALSEAGWSLDHDVSPFQK